MTDVCAECGELLREDESILVRGLSGRPSFVDLHRECFRPALARSASHSAGLDRILRQPPVPRYSAKALQRRRWRAIAEAEVQAATDCGDEDVASAFRALLATLDLGAAA